MTAYYYSHPQNTFLPLRGKVSEKLLSSRDGPVQVQKQAGMKPCMMTSYYRMMAEKKDKKTTLSTAYTASVG